MSKITANQRTTLYGIDSIAGTPDYVTVTGKKLDVNASVSISGSSIPISGATTAIVTAIVDSSGNQISTFGGGTQYTDGGVPPAHPVGNTIEWSDGSNWQTVSTAKPLPVTASFSPSGTQDINLKQINGNTTSTGNGVAGTGVQRVTIASDNTAFSVNATLSAGSAVIGHVITDTGSTTAVTGTVAVSGTITAAQSTASSLLNVSYSTTDALYNGTTALTPKFATITASSSGATTVVAAVTSKRIRVLQFGLMGNGSVNVKFQSHVTPTDITGLLYLIANTGMAAGYSPVGLFQTVAGEALDINLSAGIAVGGFLTYVEV